MQKPARFHTLRAALLTTGVISALTLAALGAMAQGAGKNAKAATQLVGDAERGSEQFDATCAECHGAAATAPTLRGIIGRPIASLSNYFGYSEALKSKKGNWTEENLDAYMKSPPTFAPGNNMYREYPDAQMRADVIAFLATLPPPK